MCPVWKYPVENIHITSTLLFYFWKILGFIPIFMVLEFFYCMSLQNLYLSIKMNQYTRTTCPVTVRLKISTDEPSFWFGHQDYQSCECDKDHQKPKSLCRWPGQLYWKLFHPSPLLPNTLLREFNQKETIITLFQSIFLAFFEIF